jgi:hypothetical protein
MCKLTVSAQNSFVFPANTKLLMLNQYTALNLQADTLFKNKNIAAPSSKKVATHSPKMATLMSAVLPGAGQIYNRKYWKAPIVWAGIGVCGYFIRNNHLLYTDYKNALIQRGDTSIKEPDKYLGVYSSDQLITLQDQYRQNRDLFIIVTTLVYVLNVVDALVDAHLFTFDVSDDLSLNWQPYFNSGVYIGNHTGVSMQLKFR